MPSPELPIQDPRPRLKLRTGPQIALSIAVLIACAGTHLYLETAVFPDWPRTLAISVELLLWLLPWLALLVFLLKSHGEARREQETLEAVTSDRDMVRALIDSLPDFIYAKDGQCRFTLANKFCCEKMGTTVEEIIGKTDFDFYPPDIAKNFAEDERRVLESGEPLLSRQEDVVDRSGEKFTILTTKVPLRDGKGRVSGIIGIGRNITARIAVEQQLREAQVAIENEMRERERIAIELRLAQKLESIGRLASGIAHEINTPIQYVGDSVHFLLSAFEDLSKLFLAYRKLAVHPAEFSELSLAQVQQLETDSDYEFLSAEVPRAIARALEGTQRVAAIVRAMKEFAHPDAQEHKGADLNRALSTTLTVARSEYRHAARLETQFEDLPEVVCNIGELNQVFLNLIVNAAHAIADAGKDATSGLIQVKTSHVGEEVAIMITDNGCGIPQAHIEKIFDPFFTTKEVGRGTGQGLALARTIVIDRHGGRVEVSSEVGKGSSFEIRIPIAGRVTAAH